MGRVLIIVSTSLLFATVSSASPYWIDHYEDFEDGDMDYPYLSTYLETAPPSNPAESYAMFTSPALNGSTGLALIQGTEEDEPFIVVFYAGCYGGEYEFISFDLESLPDGSFGTFSLHVWAGSPDVLVTSYTAPGSYSFIFPDDRDFGTTLFVGHDVVIDNLHYHTACGGTPNESVSWGGLKAMYR